MHFMSLMTLTVLFFMTVVAIGSIDPTVGAGIAVVGIGLYAAIRRISSTERTRHERSGDHAAPPA
jgi:hypothetical protein